MSAAACDRESTVGVSRKNSRDTKGGFAKGSGSFRQDEVDDEHIRMNMSD